MDPFYVCEALVHRLWMKWGCQGDFTCPVHSFTVAGLYQMQCLVGAGGTHPQTHPQTHPILITSESFLFGSRDAYPSCPSSDRALGHGKPRDFTLWGVSRWPLSCLLGKKSKNNNKNLFYFIGGCVLCGCKGV